jgi:hypothetical protein
LGPDYYCPFQPTSGKYSLIHIKHLPHNIAMANALVEALKISLIMKFDSQTFCKGDFGKCVEQQDLEFYNCCKYCRE